MKTPLWIQKATVTALHHIVIADFGGAYGIRDEGLLDSALARPMRLLEYGKPSLFDLAASYALGIAKNHPFIDGNKRAAFMTCAVFLETNGYRFEASEAEAAATFLVLAAGEMDEKELSAWLKRNCSVQKKP